MMIRRGNLTIPRRLARSVNGLELTIVIPAFNEASRLGEGMRRLESAANDSAIDVERTEFVLVDDGSTDETASTAAKLLAHYPHHRVLSLPANEGKGAAVRRGVSVAKGRAIAFMDADMAIDPHAVLLLLEGLEDHDISIGSRALPSSTVETTYVVRTLMGHVFNRLVTAWSGLGLRDTQCGFKAFRAPVARLLFDLVRIERFAFDIELLLMAHRLGLTIKEVPVEWRHVEGSTVHPFSDAMTMVRDAFRARFGLLPPRAVPAAVIVRKEPQQSPVSVMTISDILRRSGSDSDASVLRNGVRDDFRGCEEPCIITDSFQTAVLFPMLAPDEVAELCQRFRVELPSYSVHRRMVTIRSLQGMAPLPVG